MKPSIRGSAIVSGLIAVLPLAGTPARAQTAASEAAPAIDEANAAEARRLFDQGNFHYDLGEYDRAATFFRQSYERSRAPTLLFNLGQAYRLGQQCARALEAYRHFIRLSDDEALRAEASKHSQALSSTCRPQPTELVVVTPTSPVRPQQGRGDEPRSRMTTATWALAATAVLTGAAATVLAVWNGRRFDDWQDEDRALVRPLASAAEQVRRQERNDDLAASIGEADRLVIGLAVSAVLLGGGAAAIHIIDRTDEPKMALVLGPTGFVGRLQW